MKFSKALRHIDIADVKKKHHEKVVARKIKEEIEREEQEYISSVMKQVKYDWRKDISESDFTNITKGNTISQTFQHASGATITLDNTMSDTSEIPTQVTLDLGFGEKITVDAPSQNQFGITGVTRRLGITTSESGTGGGGGETVFDKVKELDQKVMQKQSAKTADEINQQLDASEKVSGAETAKVQVDGEKSDGEKSDDELVALQREGYYKKKLGPLLGNMTDARELRMNEKLIQENERENEIYKKNEVTRAKHQKVIDNKIKPLLDQINSGSDKKINLKTLYQRGAVVNKDGTRGLMIRLEEGKTVITTYRGKNISTVGSVANREKLGITGQGKMTTVAEIKDPELIKYEMPESLQRWQNQSVDPTGAIPRYAAAQLAKTGVKSAFDVLNFYIDNHVLNSDPNFDPNKRHNLTHLITDGTKNILQKGMDKLKPEIDAEIEIYKSRIPKIGEKLARSLMNDKLLGAGENPGLINSYFRSDSISNNPLQKIQKVDIFNSLGNNLGFNIDHYMKTGNYQFDSTYNFTSTLDMGVRIPVVGGVISVLSSKYVSGQLHGETAMAVNNPMQYRVDIASGKQSTFKEPSKTKPVSKQSKSDVFDRDDVSFKKKKNDKVNESNTFSKIKRIRNRRLEFYNPKDIKPEFPKNPPIKLDSKTGMHPLYGKRADRFTKLDPISADSMPLTGDPETDAIVKKQKNKKNFKEWSQQLDSMWKSDWKNKLEEGMTTSDTFITITPGKGDVDLSTTGLGYTEDGIHQLQNIPLMSTIDDPQNVGKALGGGPLGLGYHNVYGAINQYDSASKEALGQEASGYNQAVVGTGVDNNDNARLSDYIYPFDREATATETQTAKDASLVRGTNDVFRATYPTNVFGDRHKATPVTTNPTVGVDDDYDTVGLGVIYGGGGDTRTPRFFVPAGVNTSDIDTVKILASLAASNTMTTAGSQLQLYYWSGDKPGFQSLQNVNAHNVSQYPQNNGQYDGWRPIAQKPNGEIDSSVNSNIIDIIKPDGFQVGKVSEFTLQIPEWCRTTNTRFMFLQTSGNSGGPVLYSIRYQRRNALTINTTLQDEISSAYVRAGMDSNLTAAERKKKLEERLRASREYMIKSLGFADLFKDEVKISDVVSNNFDFQSVMQGSGAYGNTRFNDIISGEKRQAAVKKAQQARKKTNQRKSSNRFRGYKRTGRDSKGMTTSAKVNPKDIIGSI